MKHPPNTYRHFRWGDRTGRVLASLLLSLGLSSLVARAATYYVDGNCRQDGDGRSLACASSAGAAGPRKSLTAGISLLASPGDILNIRGVHPAHDGEAGPFDGRYHGDTFQIVGKHGTGSSAITIQPYGYAGIGTGEKVYIDGTIAPSAGWTQCTSCSTGVCAGVPGVCGDVWYATDSGAANMVIGAQKPDGTPTYRVSSASDLTNSHQGYAGTPPEIDSYSPQSGGPILVRWGQGTSAPAGSNNPKPFVYTNLNGLGFDILTTSYLTVRGLTIRCHRRQGVFLGGDTDFVTVKDNRILYNIDLTGRGSDYGIWPNGPLHATLDGNEIAWTGSEGIHTTANTSGSALIFVGNWIHDNGDSNVLGPAAVGTPSGMILSERNETSTQNGPGDYSGSVIENNLIMDQKTSKPLGSVGRGIIIESNSNNWIIRNNVFSRSGGECLKFDASGISVSGNEIYNNLFLECGRNGGDVSGNGPGIWIEVASGKASSSNSVYNNTFVNNNGGAIGLLCSGTCTGNIIRNNLMYDSGSRQLVSWGGTGVFQNNLVFSTTTGNILSFNGTSWSCPGVLASADIDRDGTSNDKNRCVDPVFVPSALQNKDFHLASLSPSIDGGTSTGMPSGRTSSINNTLAAAHGFPSYADNVLMRGTAWDIGAVEYGVSLSATVVLSDPSPTAPGSVTVTLRTSAPVVVVPAPLTFQESDGSSKSIVLSGIVPGAVFTGVFIVDSTVADGLGTFVLPTDALVDSSGNKSNVISAGAQTLIDKTPPSAPQNLHLGI